MFKTLSVCFSFLLILLPLDLAYAQFPGANGKFPPLPVIGTIVSEKEIADPIEALGTTRANETVEITANVSEIVDKVSFEDGQEVKKGDVLLTLERSEEIAALKSGKALLDERQASFKRAKELVKQQALSTATLEEREALLRQIESNIEATRAQINDRIVKAPFDGVLGLRDVSPGTLVTPGDVITTIDDLTQIKIDFDIPSIFLKDLYEGMKIEGRVDAYPGKVFSGEVVTISPQIDPVTRTVRVRAILPNEDRLLKPGFLMNITTFKNPRKTLVIPEEAVFQKQDQFFVYRILDKDNKKVAELSPITVGTRSPGQIEVVTGLISGDLIIAHGHLKARPGAQVMVQAVEEGDQPLAELLKQKQRSALKPDAQKDQK